MEIDQKIEFQPKIGHQYNPLKEPMNQILIPILLVTPLFLLVTPK